MSRPPLAESLAAFRADVTGPSSGFAVPEDAVRPVGTLHLTLGVMSFPRNDGLERAVALLRSLRPREMMTGLPLGSRRSSTAISVTPGEVTTTIRADVGDNVYGKASPEQQSGAKDKEQQPARSTAATAGGPLSITLRGLQSMQPSASRASVLYAAPVDQDGALQQFCERLRSAFQDAGLLVEDNRPLLLHATIVNTIYAKTAKARTRGPKGKQGGGGGGKLQIDARGILDRYEDWVWMDNVPVEKIAICRMGAKKTEVDGVVADEAYEVEAEIEV